MCHIDIMSTKNYKTTKLSKEVARKKIFKVAAQGRILLTSHAIQRMGERNIVLNDIVNVLLSPSMHVSDGEPHNIGFTYRCSTKKFSVAVGFTVQGDGVIVVTVFKAERRD